MNSIILKVTLLGILLLSVVNITVAQKKQVGHIRYLQIRYNGLDTLSAGKISKYSLFYKGAEVTYLDLQDRTPIAARTQQDEMVLNVASGAKIPSETYSYQNLATQVLKFNENFGFGIKLSITDNMSAISWKLSKNTKKIQNIECFSAQAEYRGRVWTAWYTPSIPVSSGPWLLYGLPGMILEAEDLNKTVQFVCEGVIIPAENVEISQPKANYSKEKDLNSKDLPKIVKERLDNAVKMLQNKQKEKGISITGLSIGVSSIEIFDFEKDMEIGRKQQKFPKK